MHVIMVLAVYGAAERASRAHMLYRWPPSALRAPGENGLGQGSVSDVDREAVAVYAWWNVTMSTSLPSGSTRVRRSEAFSMTIRPPAATAASMRAWAWS